LDNFHAGDSAVDGRPGRGFWGWCDAYAAGSGYDPDFDELHLPPQDLDLKTFDLKTDSGAFCTTEQQGKSATVPETATRQHFWMDDDQGGL
jgi:hypothetical protein